ncbi:hypothetical protein [Sulfurimonas sp.]|uniref:hypothetical protein n=1 Tax=Sulfurimonas sp. TaxID=2022749 RepID=UPI002AB0AA53|nr:hypothetical protein [Sulfurimonas sp.]
MIQLKTLKKRTATRSQGVFYKSIVNDEEKEVDKVYLIRWIDNDGRTKLKTVGKHSQGVRITTCIALRNNTISAVTLGNDAPHLTKIKSQLTLNDIAKEYFNSSKAKDIDRLENRFNIHFENNLGKKRIDNITLEDFIMVPFFKTSKTSFLILPLYDTSGNSFAPLGSKLLTAL